MSNLRTTMHMEGQKAYVKQLKQTMNMPQTILMLSPGQVTIQFFTTATCHMAESVAKIKAEYQLSTESTAKLGRQQDSGRGTVASAHNYLNQTGPQRGLGSA
ncbi:hypothetical protein EDB83DRAFT_2310466 [Lactarius deliciosus]|nr:hypothetical protein EDB83DRAFT_2310466 [Lactarius deliciosus]